MVDVVDAATRSRMMSGIRGKNTKPEIAVRKGLFARGFRYRMNDRRLPGIPDMVLPKYRAVIFVNGCFWHAHEHCPLFKWPSSRTEFWENKLLRNRESDQRALERLEADGWRVLTIWECAFRGPGKRPLEEILDEAAAWLRSGEGSQEIRSPIFPDAVRPSLRAGKRAG